MEMHYPETDVMGLVLLNPAINVSTSRVSVVFVETRFEMEQNNVTMEMPFLGMDAQIYVRLSLIGLVCHRFCQMCVIFAEIV